MDRMDVLRLNRDLMVEHEVIRFGHTTGMRILDWHKCLADRPAREGYKQLG